MLLQFSVLVANGFTIEHLEGAKFHYVQFDHNIHVFKGEDILKNLFSQFSNCIVMVMNKKALKMERMYQKECREIIFIKMAI